MEVTCSNFICAKVFKFKAGPAHFNRSIAHYCSRSCQNTTHGQAGTPKHAIWERACRRARKNGVVFTLSVADIPDVPTKCPVLGIAIKANVFAGPLDSSPSIDRIVSSRGYVPGNVRVISNRANRIRSDATAAELRLIADDATRLESTHA